VSALSYACAGRANLEAPWNGLQYGYWEIAFAVDAMSAVEPGRQCQDYHDKCIAQYRDKEEHSFIAWVTLGEECKRPLDGVQG
jgi:hypothetical protein